MKNISIKAIEKILTERKIKGITWDELAKNLPISGDGLRVSFKRKKVNEVFLNVILTDLGLISSEHEPNNENIMYVPLISKYNQTEYSTSFNSNSFINSLPKISWDKSNLNENKNNDEYKTFEINGNSMNDKSYMSLIDGDLVLCLCIPIAQWKTKLNILKWNYLLLHKQQGILIQKIIRHNKADGIITCHSLNEQYKDKDIELSDINEIYKIVQLRRITNF